MTMPDESPKQASSLLMAPPSPLTGDPAWIAGFRWMAFSLLGAGRAATRLAAMPSYRAALIETDWKRWLEGLAHHVYRAVEEGRNGPPIRVYAIDMNVAEAYQIAAAALEEVADMDGPNEPMMAALEHIAERLSRWQAPADPPPPAIGPEPSGNPPAGPAPLPSDREPSDPAAAGSVGTPRGDEPNDRAEASRSKALPPIEPPDLVTLNQAAAIVNASKRTLERHKTKGELPDPAVEGGAGKAARYDWKVMRPWLESKFAMKLPEHFPGNRRHA